MSFFFFLCGAIVGTPNCPFASVQMNVRNGLRGTAGCPSPARRRGAIMACPALRGCHGDSESLCRFGTRLSTPCILRRIFPSGLKIGTREPKAKEQTALFKHDRPKISGSSNRGLEMHGAKSRPSICCDFKDFYDQSKRTRQSTPAESIRDKM